MTERTVERFPKDDRACVRLGEYCLSSEVDTLVLWKERGEREGPQLRILRYGTQTERNP